MTATRTGAQALCDALRESGVDCVFGLPGTQTVEIYEALRTSGIRTIVATHEMAAAFMANGYARIARKPGVLLTISGPGVAFAPAGLAEAKLDAIPLVHLTVAPAAGPTGEPSFQAFDQAALVRPVVKATLRAEERTRIAAVVREAFAIAAAPDPGPVFVEIAPRALHEAGMDVPAPGGSSTTPGHAGDHALNSIVDALVAAQRPIVLVASDCTDAADALAHIASDGRVPVLISAPHRGVLPEDHLWALCGDDQRTSFEPVQEFVSAADLVVVLGTRLTHVATAGFRLALSPQRVVCISGTGEALPHGYSARTTATAPPGAFLQGLAGLASRFSSTWLVAEVAEWRRRFAAASPSDPPEPRVNGGTPAAFFAALRAALPRNAILVTDSGLHQVLTRRHYEVLAPGGLLFPSDFQSMGFGLPAALGAKAASPARAVVVVLGDGGFLMSGLELTTAVREKIPIIVIVFNDGQLNLIRVHQLREFGHAHGVELLVPDLAQFAGSVGARYRPADDLMQVIHDALEAPEPTLIEVAVGDSRSITGVRVMSLARETMRRAMGPRALRWLKGKLR